LGGGVLWGVGGWVLLGLVGLGLGGVWWVGVLVVVV
jgi:hypothetical protein